MALANSKFQTQAAGALSAIAANGIDIRIKRFYFSKAKEDRQPAAQIPIIFSCVIVPASLGESLQRFENEISGKDTALISIKRFDAGFKGEGIGWLFDDDKGVSFNNGVFEKSETAGAAPYIQPGDFFNFVGREYKALNIETINPDGAYPVLFQCIVG